jgi:hypothetical protein
MCPSRMTHCTVPGLRGLLGRDPQSVDGAWNSFLLHAGSRNRSSAVPNVAHKNISLSVAAVFALALTQLSTPPAVAAEYDVGSIHITQPWARATAKGATTGAGYMTITNKGTTPDRVSCISSDASVQCQMHSMTMEAGVITTCSALFGPRPTCGLGPMADSTRY